MHPSFVIGKNELLTDAKDVTIGTNGAAIALVLGYMSKISVVGANIHVDDVASMHVKALDSKIPAET
jgi:transketolase C-terminal domain/subunit